ncbi:hypothetical protein A2U01_0105947, partial [Trifolium medium]|nr:hypothetical protein [Trifolium medium]
AQYLLQQALLLLPPALGARRDALGADAC